MIEAGVAYTLLVYKSNKVSIKNDGLFNSVCGRENINLPLQLHLKIYMAFKYYNTKNQNKKLIAVYLN